MRRTILHTVAAGMLVSVAGTANAELLYATNGSSIFRFDSTDLGTVTTIPLVAFLTPGETLVDIDVTRGRSLLGVTSAGRLYSISPNGVVFPSGLGMFTPDGTAFGLDFDPVTGQGRVVSNAEQNLRVTVASFMPADIDTNLTPAGNVVATAYTNNVLGATSTTLYGIDSAAGTLVMIGGVNGTPSPNAGAVITVGSLGLGTNLNEAIGFDVSGESGIAFASITTAGSSRLYTINLATGLATLATSNAGTIGTGATPFLGFAAAAAPEPASLALLGIAAAGLLRRRRLAARR